MTRALVLAAVLLAAAPAAAQAERLFVNGDSLAVGARPYMPDALPRWRIATSASVGRHAREGPPVLSARSRLPRHIAVSLGTNDDPRHTDAFRAAVEETMAIAGEGRCVVWANIVRPPVAGASYGGYNRVLREEAAEHGNLELVDWRTLVRRHPAWLTPDGVHVTADGYRGRARAFARALRRCPA
jgi:lysophospholipase L1-like esterase